MCQVLFRSTNCPGRLSFMFTVVPFSMFSTEKSVRHSDIVCAMG
ncbi:unnamed protein product [Ascophyllum nodosum]